jgi:hypothetical protein
MDVISKLGGYKGAFEPVLMYFYPIIILHFLIHYSNTIRGIYNDKYKSELERTLRAAFDRVREMPDLELKLKLNNKEENFKAL